MRVHKDEVDVRMQIPGAVIRQRMNFGDASRRMEGAKDPLRRMRQRYAGDGKTDAARSIGAAIEHVEEAQRLAGKLDQAANSKTGEALEAIKVATSK